jgi:hypothetical protein
MLAAVDSNGWVYSLNNLLSSPKDWGWFRAVDVTPLILGLETSVHFAVTQGEIHALVETLGVVTHSSDAPVARDNSPSESSHQTGEPTVGNEWIPPAVPICPARL